MPRGSTMRKLQPCLRFREAMVPLRCTQCGSVPYFSAAMRASAEVEDQHARHSGFDFVGVCYSASGAWAQDAAADYPNRPIKIIVSVPAGGGVDTVTRIVAERLQQRLGQPVVVENRAGAGGNIGAEAVFTSDPDGYTLLAAQPAPLTINPLLYKKIDFDPTAVRAGGDHDHGRQCAAGAAGFPRQDRAGIHRLCQGQSGQDQLRLAGHRHHLASDRGAVREGDRDQARARALQAAPRRRSTISSPATST